MSDLDYNPLTEELPPSWWQVALHHLKLFLTPKSKKKDRVNNSVKIETSDGSIFIQSDGNLDIETGSDQLEDALNKLRKRLGVIETKKEIHNIREKLRKDHAKTIKAIRKTVGAEAKQRRKEAERIREKARTDMDELLRRTRQQRNEIRSRLSRTVGKSKLKKPIFPENDSFWS